MTISFVVCCLFSQHKICLKKSTASSAITLTLRVGVVPARVVCQGVCQVVCPVLGTVPLLHQFLHGSAGSDTGRHRQLPYRTEVSGSAWHMRTHLRRPCHLGRRSQCLATAALPGQCCRHPWGAFTHLPPVTTRKTGLVSLVSSSVFWCVTAELAVLP